MPDPQPDLMSRDLCFIDVETTGPVFGYHEILELGAIRTSPDAREVIGQWTRRVVPQHPGRITDFAQQLTGYYPREWSEAQLGDARFWNDFAAFASATIPVCHNPSFDRSFICLSAVAAGVKDLGVDYHWIGTESLGWPLYRKGLLPKLSLEGLCDFLEIPREPRPHRALKGANTCLQVYAAIMTRYLSVV